MDVSWDDLGRPDREGEYPFQGREIRVTQREIGIWNQHPTAVFAVSEHQPLSGGKLYVLGGFEVRRTRLRNRQIVEKNLLEWLQGAFSSAQFELIDNGLGVSVRNPNYPQHGLQIEVEGDNFRVTTTSASTENPDFGDTSLLGTPQELEQYIRRFLDPQMPPGVPNQQAMDEANRIARRYDPNLRWENRDYWTGPPGEVVGSSEATQSPHTKTQPRLRARTSTGRAVLRNQVQIALSSEALFLLIDQKIASLRAERPNSDEATAARDESIAAFERLKQSLEELRTSTFAFLTGQGKERPVEQSSNAFFEGLKDWWSKRHVQAFDMGLFLSGVSFCSLLGVGAPLAAVICGALVGGKSVSDAIKALKRTPPGKA